MKRQQIGAGTRMGWYAMDDGHVRVEIECPLVAAPGVLTNLARSMRLLAHAQDPEGLAAADAVNAVAAEMMAAATKAQGGEG
jgi:hypothetical protein